jgi:hypothetical protein
VIERKQPKPVHLDLTGAAPLDVEKLVESRLLIQANSGGGKSWAIRRLLEQTYQHVPHIVLDVEGEFHTLREKYDYVLAGARGADCPADLKTAPLLARRLLEVGVSAIIDIYELGAQRTTFVKLFLEAMVNAPRELWRPVLVVVDEAHLFAPEGAKCESAAAVVDLMTRGRKRGFCGVLATQRIAKLRKDAAAECNNKLIGRCGLDIDMRRAATELGITGREEMMRLRRMPAGHFFAFGPALQLEVTEITIGPVETTHPKAGQRAAPPTSPSAAVRKVLAQLADLPHAAEEEARTIDELRQRVHGLERQLAARPAVTIETKTIDVPVLTAENLTEVRTAIARIDQHARVMEDVAAGIASSARNLEARLGAAIGAVGRAAAQRHFATDGKVVVQTGRHEVRVRPSAAPATPGETTLGGGERKILTALAQYPGGRTKNQVAILTGYAHGGGGFNNYISSLRGKGYIEGDSDQLTITGAGADALGAWTPLPTGRALYEHWCSQLGKAEREILRVLFEAWPHALEKFGVASKTGYGVSGGGFNNALSRLRTLELIEGKGSLRCSDALHDGGDS